MNNYKELWGSRLELSALIILFVGSLWQAGFSGWWDQQLPEWQALIQEKVNLAALFSLNDIASITSINDQKLRESLADDVRKRTYRVNSDIIDERNRRSKVINSGQAAKFWKIRDFLIILGAFLFMVGKLLSLQGVKERTLRQN